MYYRSNSRDVMIRNAKKDDIKAICFLSNEVNAEHSEAMPDTFAKIALSDRDADYWLAYLARDDAHILLIEFEGSIKGMAAVSIPTGLKPSFLVDKRVCNLSTIVVARSARRQGLGKQLILAVERYAHENDASEVLLEVMQFNQLAIAFYRSVGYDDFSTKLAKSLN